MCRLMPAVALLVLVAVSSMGCTERVAIAPTEKDVIVTVGDSITDVDTYPQIIRQAIKEAGKPLPAVVCSGTACDTAPNMLARLNCSALCFKPTLVTFMSGGNDAGKKESAEVYAQAVREVVKRVKASGAKMILLTPCIANETANGKLVKDKDGRDVPKPSEAFIAQYAVAIHKIAQENGLPVALNYELQTRARAEGKEVLCSDGAHPNYFGQSLMARCILDAMGYADVPLPNEYRPQLLPGVIAKWSIRLAPLDEKKRPLPVTEEAVKTLGVSDFGKEYTLPDATPLSADPGEFREQCRRNGFAQDLDKLVGKGPKQGLAVIVADQPKKVWISTALPNGATWLNGKKIDDNKVFNDGGKTPRYTPCHAGGNRFEAELVKGTNLLFIEIPGQEFFVSVNDKLVWETDMK